jgi:hypothetical protein
MIRAIPLDGPATAETPRKNIGKGAGESLTRLGGAAARSHGAASFRPLTFDWFCAWVERN